MLDLAILVKNLAIKKQISYKKYGMEQLWHMLKLK